MALSVLVFLGVLAAFVVVGAVVLAWVVSGRSKPAALPSAAQIAAARGDAAGRGGFQDPRNAGPLL